MKLVYYSLTGNTRRFANKLKEKYSTEIEELKNYEQGEYILATPTYKFGEVPEDVTKFLQINSDKCKGVIAGGNRNWGSTFACAGDTIAQDFNIPLILKIEQAGNTEDIEFLSEYFSQS